MQLSIKFVGATSTAFAVAALATAPLVAAAPEDAFLDALEQQGVTWEGATPANMIAAGEGVCQDWSNGATFAQEVASLEPHLGTEDAAFLIGAATAAFCPQYESKLN
ncbi:hypothetical protein AU193_15910 [Mycobacterium sp. GA-1285]|uniref:DUF732 domain-containing protein n=1 Tax=Mycobacterium sp. GA-1285 TaxID=1772282 RepID=UPI00074728D0|nr:DUF732 domain-containing protein [Mycobacterium sp. GA-1285]KUI16249.1 hypothetical protein AU193_15910 [Mycobacterium sp. GA-1285]